MNKIYQKECETSCEYSLPDYMGDVKKILTVSASAIPSGKFASDGEVEFSGVVSYDILYSDSEGKLTRVYTSSDYDVAVPVVSESYIDSMSTARVANLSVRLTGPRKFVAKAIVSNNIKVSGEDVIATAGSAFSTGYTPEVKEKNIKLENMIFAVSPEREYAEEAEHINGVSPDGVEIIATSGAVRITEVEPSEGGVRVKGELIITSIVRTEEQPPFAIRKTVPFEETVSMEGAAPDMQVLADAYLTSVTSGVAEDADGSVITVSAISEIYCIAATNKETSVMTDAYLKERDTVCEYEELSYSELLCMSTAEEGFSTSIARSETGLEEIREILCVSAEPRSYNKKITHTGFELSGDLAVSGIACEINDDSSVSYIPVKFTAPFSVNVNCGCQIPEDSVIDCTVSAIDATSALDPERLTVRCGIKVGYRVSKPASVRRITSCSVVGDSEYPKNSSCVTVYYPEEGESLFDIAKKFHTATVKIAADNRLTEEVSAISDAPILSSGVKRLIIR